jgi:hypothetical protein
MRAMLLLAASLVTPGAANAIALSHGVQLLPIAVEECARRGAAALQAEGYGAPAPAVLMSGFKGPHGAYVYCGARPDGATTVNIFVATENVADGEVPGAERLRLQARLAAGIEALPAAGGASVPAAPLATQAVPAAPAAAAASAVPAVPGFAGQWDSNHGSMTLQVQRNQLTGTYTEPPGRIQGAVNGPVFGGHWVQAGRRGRLRLELAPDGRSFTGTWTEADGRGGGPWNGTRRR